MNTKWGVFLHKEYENCNLCPRRCSVNRSKTKGYCNADDKTEISRAALHFMEEPVISGANGSGTIFFSHCNLGCIYCQNFEISRKTSKGRKISDGALAEEMLNLQSIGAHNINLVTPTHYMPSIKNAIILAKNQGLNIPIVYNTGGFENIDSIKALDGLIDIYLTDLKYFSPYYSKLYSLSEDYFDHSSEAIEQMINSLGKYVVGEDGLMKKGVILRHLILPGLENDTAQILKYISKMWGDKVLVSLMRQYTPINQNLPHPLTREITDEEYNSACELFEVLGLEGFVQQAESVGKDKIPTWDLTEKKQK